MPELVWHVIDVVEARPLTCALIAVAAVLYLRFMMSGPRTH